MAMAKVDDHSWTWSSDPMPSLFERQLLGAELERGGRRTSLRHLLRQIHLHVHRAAGLRRIDGSGVGDG